MFGLVRAGFAGIGTPSQLRTPDRGAPEMFHDRSLHTAEVGGSVSSARDVYATTSAGPRPGRDGRPTSGSKD